MLIPKRAECAIISLGVGNLVGFAPLLMGASDFLSGVGRGRIIERCAQRDQPSLAPDLTCHGLVILDTENSRACQHSGCAL